MKKQKSTQDRKQNKKLIIASVALVAVVVISCVSLMFVSTLNSNNPEESPNTQQTAQQKTYQTVSSDELFALLDETDSSHIVYIGRATCPHCSIFAPKLIEVISEQDASVYYYDTATARADDAEKLNELMDKLEISSVPALIEIKDGLVNSRLDDYESKESITHFINARQ